MNIKYVHTNIIAHDWQKLARFYIDVFGCEPVYPERDIRGAWIEEVTGIRDVHIRGIHLRLPGYERGPESEGPTLEIFQYDHIAASPGLPAINGAGFAHIAFLVDDVAACLDMLLANGGHKLGEMVVQELEYVGILTVVYARDPEGNIVEIQNWQT